MSTTTMIIITATLTLASAPARHACDEDAARALKRPWAPVVFHGDRETSESLPEIDARFTPDGDADELMRALRRSGGGDLFIENTGTADGASRVKILGVVSADCH